MKTKKNRENNFLNISLIFFSFIGIIDSFYLTLQHYQNSFTECSFLEGCKLVTTSEYATIFSFPVSGLGFLFYLAIFVTSLLFISSKTGGELFIKLIIYLSVLGFLVSLSFVYLQLFVIEAICLYCMISAGISTLLLVFSVLIFIKNLSAKNE